MHSVPNAIHFVASPLAEPEPFVVRFRLQGSVQVKLHQLVVHLMLAALVKGVWVFLRNRWGPWELNHADLPADLPVRLVDRQQLQCYLRRPPQQDAWLAPRMATQQEQASRLRQGIPWMEWT